MLYVCTFDKRLNLGKGYPSNADELIVGPYPQWIGLESSGPVEGAAPLPWIPEGPQQIYIWQIESTF